MATNRSIYLDYAAATPVDARVLKSMVPYFSEHFYNPSAMYLHAKAIRKDIDEARSSVSRALGVRSAEIVFTAGGSEANNICIAGIMQNFPDKHAVVSAVEHDSIVEPVKKYNHSLVPVNEDGKVRLDELESLITDDTVLVSIMYVNNELGTVMPLRKISNIVADIKKSRAERGVEAPLYLHTDACQAPLYFDTHCDRLGVDLMTLNGGKIYGPKQSGVLYVKSGTMLEPLVRGGGQEWGKRSGTENVPGIIGFSSALVNAANKQPGQHKTMAKLQQTFLRGIKKDIPNSVINGSIKNRSPNNIHVTFPGHDNERLMMELDEAGIMCAVGSACSASSDEPSHVLKAIGLSDADAQSSLRFTLGKHTTEEDILYTLNTLKKLITP